MVSDVQVLELLLLFKVVALLDVGSDLLLHDLSCLLAWVWSVLGDVLHFQSFESKSVVPVSIELAHFLLFVPSWHRQLLTPEWSVRLHKSFVHWVDPVISDNILVVQ